MTLERMTYRESTFWMVSGTMTLRGTWRVSGEMDSPNSWANILLQEEKKNQARWVREEVAPWGPGWESGRNRKDGGTGEGLHEPSSEVKSRLYVFGLLQPAECFWGVEWRGGSNMMGWAGELGSGRPGKPLWTRQGVWTWPFEGPGRASLAGYQAGTCHGSSKVHCPCPLSTGAHALSPYFHSSRRLFTQGIVTSSQEQAEQQILKGYLCFAQSVACRVGGKKLDIEIFGTLGTTSVFRMLLQGIWASSSWLITSCMFSWKMLKSQQVWGCTTPTNSEDAIPSP